MILDVKLNKSFVIGFERSAIKTFVEFGSEILFLF